MTDNNSLVTPYEGPSGTAQFTRPALDPNQGRAAIPPANASQEGYSTPDLPGSMPPSVVGGPNIYHDSDDRESWYPYPPREEQL